ncbi:hypothetical protein SAMN05443247_08216 [Bradyrhizobium erythrophlei]|nr:hypothetical protein SAMN05443247_08216 [Bradyrhizobium erythrophlei]
MPTRARETFLSEYYVLLCARRYAEMVGKLMIAATDDDRRRVKMNLSYILGSGLIEYEWEYKRRVRPYPDDFRKALIEKDGSIISRPISRDEAEILRYSNAIPTFSSIDKLSALEMQGLADMYEGWAQSDRTDCVNVARLHGWSDGLRILVEVVGIDYVPPEPPPGAQVSLMKFLAVKMRE